MDNKQQAQAKAPRFGDALPPGGTSGEATKRQVMPLREDRMVAMAQALGEMQLVTLPEDQAIEEGEQDPKLWTNLGPRLVMGQWISVTNDCGSFWRVMRVELVHCGRGAGLRALVLRDVVPPRMFDKTNEPIVATGEWYVRYLGPSRRWAVIRPNGMVAREMINTEQEAARQVWQMSGNPRPL